MHGFGDQPRGDGRPVPAVGVHLRQNLIAEAEWIDC
jgi:hypothetical protein